MKTNKALAYSYDGDKAILQNFAADEIHTTLPMDDLIGIFETEISSIINYDSFEYKHLQKGNHVFRGTLQAHKCQYKIKGLGIELGLITLTRNKPFDEKEMLLIEKALGALSIHLKNAMEYQSGLNKEHLEEFQIETQLAHIK
ncbi:MAG: hypothetical protein COA71_09475 [SAR86 cluster bacterium]|uniref:GAF domain-containing protein n=1 Tax=SAR86 cluster bacterium TaxID=2030880 RepID=A0A2A5CAN9_9GAMM|nr:MAG: hypothetical protein COA71_09475 [SAR86 cluster bacterium]